MKCFWSGCAAAMFAVTIMVSGGQAASLSSTNIDTGAAIHTTAVANAARGIANDRNLRQSFTVNDPIRVESVQIGFDTSDQNAGLQMRVFKVLGANDDPWSPDGAAITDLVLAAYDGSGTANAVPDVGAATSSNALQIDLDGGEQFVLSPGAYAIEFSTDDPNQVSNVGTWQHSNIDPNDFYPDGIMYTETGNIARPYRDFVLSINGTIVPEPSSLILACCGLLFAATRRK